MNCATARAAQTPFEMKTVAKEENRNSTELDFHMGFSPMSVNQNLAEQETPGLASFDALLTKQKLSKEQLQTCLDNFATVLKDVVKSSSEQLCHAFQNMGTAAPDQNKIIADELQRFGIPFEDRMVIFRNLVRQPENAEFFRTLQSEQVKMGFVQVNLFMYLRTMNYTAVHRTLVAADYGVLKSTMPPVDKLRY